MEISKEWVDHPDTQEFIKYLRTKHQDILDGWAAGAFTGANGDATLQLNAKALGMVEVLDELITGIRTGGLE